MRPCSPASARSSGFAAIASGSLARGTRFVACARRRARATFSSCLIILGATDIRAPAGFAAHFPLFGVDPHPPHCHSLSPTLSVNPARRTVPAPRSLSAAGLSSRLGVYFLWFLAWSSVVGRRLAGAAYRALGNSDSTRVHGVKAPEFGQSARRLSSAGVGPPHLSFRSFLPFFIYPPFSRTGCVRCPLLASASPKHAVPELVAKSRMARYLDPCRAYSRGVERLST